MSESDTPAQERFDSLLDQANEQDTTIEERAARLERQQVDLARLDRELREMYEKRRAAVADSIEELNNDDDSGLPKLASE